MIVHIEPDNNAEPPNIKLYSDAPTEQEARREIKGWATLNNAAQLRTPRLQTAVFGGVEVYVGTAYDAETIVTEGRGIYDGIGEALEAKHLGRIVAIDILSHDYSVAAHEHQASLDLREKHPGAVVYLGKIGYNAFAGIGARPVRTRRS